MFTPTFAYLFLCGNPILFEGEGGLSYYLVRELLMEYDLRVSSCNKDVHV